MEKKKRYRVTIERDEKGWWVATVRGIAGVHTQARTLAQLRERALEALEAAEPQPEDPELVFDWRSGSVKRLIEEAREARESADKEGARAQELLRRAARALEAEGIGRRDAGELLGLSFQRVQQLVE